MSFGSKNRKEKWALIPSDTEILITHMPPRDIMDCTVKGQWGDKDLKDEVIKRIKPNVHIFGHVHEGYGFLTQENITFINCACEVWPPDALGRKVRDPIWFDYDIEKHKVVNIEQWL